MKEGIDPKKIIDFSASVNPLGLSPRAKKKILKEGPEAVLHYPDSGCGELRTALAQFHGIPEDCILPGAGSTEFIYSLPRVMKLERILLVTPAFSEYENALEIQSRDCRIHFFESREEDGFELNVEGLLLAMTERYDALYLCNPNNPTGILTEREDLLRVLSRAEREKVWFILDEAFIDFIPGESLLREAARSSRLVVLRSMTKFYALPGLRSGYLVSNPGVIEKVSRVKEPWAVNAVESLRDPVYAERTLAYVRQEREALTLGLQGIPGFIPYPSSANYLLIQLHPSLNLTAAELRQTLIPRGILIRVRRRTPANADCQSFHHLGPYFFRVAVRSRSENQALLKALRQVHKEKVKGAKA